MARILFAALFSLMLASPSLAQNAAWRFRWQAGQVLDYRAEHTTSVSELVGGNKVDLASKLSVVKRWEVIEVDPQGAATVRLLLLAMRHEQTRPNGETMLFDSANLDKSTPELREQMTKFIGQTLAILRVDALGRVVEVKQGSASKYEAEPPFMLLLPGQAVDVGQAWERSYEVTLEPPVGTGEKFAATQRYHLLKADGSLATLRLTTTIKSIPENQTDQVPLLQKMPEGDVIFNIAAGRLESVNVRIDKQLQNHQGEGSSYRFISTYQERYIGK